MLVVYSSTNNGGVHSPEGSPVRLFILNACHNNPYHSSNVLGLTFHPAGLAPLGWIGSSISLVYIITLLLPSIISTMVILPLAITSPKEFFNLTSKLDLESTSSGVIKIVLFILEKVGIICPSLSY